MKRACFAVFFIVMVIISPSMSAPVLIPNVPAYTLYHGCGPTSLGMVFGYYDLNGYPNFFSASGSAVYSTANVQDEISSPAHNAKYDPHPDVSDSILPVPPSTSIADWFGTSVGPLGAGDSWWYNASVAVAGYAAYKGYTFTGTDTDFDSTWPTLVNEVNHCRPMLFFVNSGSGVPDHIVPVFGYDDRGAGGQWYACYTTTSESETPVWKQFQNALSIYGVDSSEQIVAATLTGDTNRDGALNTLDIDAIYQHFGQPSTSQWKVCFDNNPVGQDDVTYELRNIFHTNYGDANLNTYTDFPDFQTLLDHWQGPGGWVNGDFNGDGIVDFLDFQKLLDYWNPGGWNTSQSETPEPTSLCLLLLGAFMVLRRKKSTQTPQ